MCNDSNLNLHPFGMCSCEKQLIASCHATHIRMGISLLY